MDSELIQVFSPIQNDVSSFFDSWSEKTALTFRGETASKVDNLAQSVMVYGFRHCHMWEVLSTAYSCCDKVYNYSYGREPDEEIGSINDFLSSNSKTVNRLCKDGLVEMVLNNYSNRLQDPNYSITPILFCVDTDENEYPVTAEDFVNKDIITFSELRRAYKLCNDKRVDESVRNIAKETFLFVHVRASDYAYELTKVAPPWETLSGIEEMWAAKKEKKKQQGIEAKKEVDWRDYVAAKVKSFQKKFASQEQKV